MFIVAVCRHTIIGIVQSKQTFVTGGQVTVGSAGTRQQLGVKTWSQGWSSVVLISRGVDAGPTWKDGCAWVSASLVQHKSTRLSTTRTPYQRSGSLEHLGT